MSGEGPRISPVINSEGGRQRVVIVKMVYTNGFSEAVRRASCGIERRRSGFERD